MDKNVEESIVKKAKIEDYWYIPFEMKIPITDIHPYRSSNDVIKTSKEDDETIQIVKISNSNDVENEPINLVVDINLNCACS